MNVLIGDIGNTNTKICLIEYQTFKIKRQFYFNSKSINSENFMIKNLKKIVSNNSIYKIALFSSVVPNYHLKMKKLFKKLYNVQLIEIKEEKINKIVKIKVKNKNQVGSDRIANAVGVYKKYKYNSIVVDFGTATTFDVVTNDGIYNGGVIAPGVNLSLMSLIDSADQIPNFLLKKQKKIVGKNTIEAVRSGFYWGYSGLINNIISKIEKETKKKYRIIFTGGYANLFKSSIKRSFRIDKNITIRGIIEIFKKNKSYFK